MVILNNQAIGIGCHLHLLTLAITRQTQIFPTYCPGLEFHLISKLNNQIENSFDKKL